MIKKPYRGPRTRHTPATLAALRGHVYAMPNDHALDGPGLDDSTRRGLEARAAARWQGAVWRAILIAAIAACVVALVGWAR